MMVDMQTSSDSTMGKVTLRAEVAGKNSRNLWAYIDAEGNLHIDGQDLGPSTAPGSSDGEYEWFQTIQAAEVSRLIGLLGAPPDSDILEVLKEHWSGSKAGDFERLLRESDIQVTLYVWAG